MWFGAGDGTNAEERVLFLAFVKEARSFLRVVVKIIKLSSEWWWVIVMLKKEPPFVLL